jgi:hypothetical protein
MSDKLQFVDSPFSQWEKGLGMRAYAHTYFCCLCSVGGEWHSKTKNQLKSDAAVSPHPNPLPGGEGVPALAPHTKRYYLVAPLTNDRPDD